METELVDAVRGAAERADVREAVEDVYRQLADAIAIRKPICTASGRCCRFEEYGHRLYLTTMELAKFVADLSAIRVVRKLPDFGGRTSPSAAEFERPTRTSALQKTTILPVFPVPPNECKPDPEWDGRGCPFQIGGLCGVHEIRPFGCRIFFCDPTSVQWQHDQYELHHGRLRQLHEALLVPYHYVEWRFALKSLGLAGG